MDYSGNDFVKNLEVDRIIFSWLIAGGDLKGHPGIKGHEPKMCEWLRSFTVNGEHFTEDEIRGIWNHAKNGKLELQELAKQFLQEGA